MDFYGYKDTALVTELSDWKRLTIRIILEVLDSEDDLDIVVWFWAE